MSPYVRRLLAHLHDASIALLVIAVFILFVYHLGRVVMHLLS